MELHADTDADRDAVRQPDVVRVTLEQLDAQLESDGLDELLKDALPNAVADGDTLVLPEGVVALDDTMRVVAKRIARKEHLAILLGTPIALKWQIVINRTTTCSKTSRPPCVSSRVLVSASVEIYLGNNYRNIYFYFTPRSLLVPPCA